jgi:hypothetical protein
MENEGMIQEIQFHENNTEHCITQIKTAFAQLSLKSWYFYRPESGSGKLLRSEWISMNNCDFKAFNRCFSINKLFANYNLRLASGAKGPNKLQKIYIGPIPPQSFLQDDDRPDNRSNVGSDDDLDIQQPTREVRTFPSSTRSTRRPVQSSTRSIRRNSRLNVNSASTRSSRHVEIPNETSTTSFNVIQSLQLNESDDESLPDIADIIFPQRRNDQGISAFVFF